jgi:Cu-Zn family superoxide dismutase
MDHHRKRYSLNLPRALQRGGIVLGLVLGSMAVHSATCPAQEGPGPTSLTVTLRDAEGTDVGRATIIEAALGIVVRATLEGLPPGTHAFHVHETGMCEPPFVSAGGHLSAPGSRHGILSLEGMHEGDLPNVHVPESGTIAVDVFVEGVTLGERGEPLSLLDDDGSALVVHEGADDYLTDPSGNAGDRIACGAITR